MTDEGRQGIAPVPDTAIAGGAETGRGRAAWVAPSVGRLKATAREAVAARRRRPPPAIAGGRWLGLRSVEWWTVAASAILAALVFLDAPAIHWARDLDRGVVALFRAVTDIGKSDWLLIPTGLLCLWLASRPVATLTRRGRARVEAWLGLLGFGFVVVAGSGLAVALLKRIIGRARPKHFDTSGVFDFSPFAVDASYASFPSGHVTTLFALAAIIAFVAPNYRWPAFAAALWLGFSRVAIGAHYPSDAVAGVAFALWFALGSRAAFAERGHVFDRDGLGRYRLKTPRLLASVFVFGRARSRRPRTELAR